MREVLLNSYCLIHFTREVVGTSETQVGAKQNKDRVGRHGKKNIEANNTYVASFMPYRLAFVEKYDPKSRKEQVSIQVFLLIKMNFHLS